MRTVGAVVAILLLVAAGCEGDLPRFGEGHYCQRDDQCLEGFSCIARECTAPPARRGDQPGPADAGRDAGAREAGPPLDAGSPEGGVDAGGAPDAGGADASGDPDAGSDPDAATDPDAGSAPDAGPDAAP
jgi:hypothetical protein